MLHKSERTMHVWPFSASLSSVSLQPYSSSYGADVTVCVRACACTLLSDKSCSWQAKPAPSQHPSYPLTSWSIMLWFTGTPPTHTHNDPLLSSSPPPSKLPLWPASILPLPPPTYLPHLITLSHASALCATLPQSHPSAHHFLLPPALWVSLTPSRPLSCFKCLSRCLRSSHPSSQWKERELSLSWVCDPCQGDKLPTAACLHSWKIKNLWGREGSRCLCVNVCAWQGRREMLIDQSWMWGKKRERDGMWMCVRL